MLHSTVSQVGRCFVRCSYGDGRCLHRACVAAQPELSARCVAMVTSPLLLGGPPALLDFVSKASHDDETIISSPSFFSASVTLLFVFLCHTTSLLFSPRSTSLPLAGVKSLSLSLTSEHGQLLGGSSWAPWGPEGPFPAPVQQLLVVPVIGKALLRNSFLCMEIHVGRSHLGAPPFFLENEIWVNLSSKPLLWADFAEWRPISLQC